ncbi:MAG: hypothetical protein Q4P14_02240 [Methanobacteriaceae archaeon]|nr:hypothetical protein [Methanobacteriaceae archaeon]
MKRNLNIAIAAEIAPAKTIIPVLEKLKDLDLEDKLNFKINKIIALYHGLPAKDLLQDYCDEFYDIGEGRRGTPKYKLPFLISRDIIKAYNALRGKNIDLLITVGNAGDVRKSIVAANILKIPILHIEQDIYNPIEVISQANIVTVPNEKYLSILKGYGLKNVVNIHGYPMVSYVSDSLKKSTIKNIKDNSDILVVLGGDLKKNQLPLLLNELKHFNKKIFIAPYRFNREYVMSLINSENFNSNSENHNSFITVLDQYVDLISYLKSTKFLIYAAGMGMTIEAGLMEVSSIKIEGFHKEHASVDLAKSLGIPVVKIEDIKDVDFDSINVDSNNLLESSEIAIDEIVDIINNFDFLSKRSGLKVTKNIWNVRKIYR